MVNELSPTLIALQEAPSEVDLRTTLGGVFDVVRTTSGVASAHDTRCWSCDKSDIGNPRVAVLGLRPVGASTSVWMLNVHGPALFVDDEGKREFVRAVAKRLEALRIEDSLRREIIAGDVNLPPFDASIMRSGGLHATRCLPWAADRTNGINRALFNPTWALLGRHSDASGTFYRSEIALDGPWCAIDQVMVSADLAAGGHSIHVVETVRGSSLRTTGRVGMPDPATGSDHLPLFASLTVP